MTRKTVLKTTATKTVGEMMTAPPLTVTPDMPLKDAVQLLATHRISGLPVVDKAGEAVGEISETDLMWQVSGASLPAYVMLLDSVVYLTNPARYNQELHKALGQTVADVMSHKVTLVQADDDLQRAAQLMHDKQIRRLLVVDDNRHVIGILTRGDIVRELAQQYT
ncbi:CBS domain-containing protein [Leptolyngbya cf. ectocarpi LEGE 11479]|uniref:CBS domain-containing protein n=1 Tax=Leptolyngbya cf. ectocarpi LEGE 11479 TaxID=1828722 RepID=A0A928ZQ83_LEPEC|nr:CBS domain-containing protein [Leptolyngbya ectocarpi]MBE9065113.1 CBS domain-containing protein [Leptolyngbya cf. ectocarpi LEGE 11479]